MEALVDDTLTLAREGKDIDESESVPVEALVEDARTSVDGVELIVESGLGTLAGAEERLCRVFENLFRNAREHGGEGTTVRVGPLPDGFFVEDDGPGIPAGERKRVFESGYSTAAEGTGFGLAIVEEAIEAHGWQVGAVEGTNGGARFEITGVDWLRSGPGEPTPRSRP